MRVSQSLMILERFISRRWRDNPSSASDNLSYTEYDYLETLDELGSVRLSDMAAIMRVSKPTVSNMVARLEQKQLVVKRPCIEDRRVLSLILSEKGRALLEKDRAFFNRFIEELLQGMSKTDQAQLEKLLARMVSQTKNVS